MARGSLKLINIKWSDLLIGALRFRLFSNSSSEKSDSRMLSNLTSLDVLSVSGSLKLGEEVIPAV